MAELPNLGKHCAVEICNRLDFLPFTCDGCSKIFCSDHRTKDLHKCSQVNISSQGCVYTGAKGYNCSLDGCKNRELTRLECPKCLQPFCLSHRHAVDHQCPKLLEEESRNAVGSKTAKHVQDILASKPAISAPKKPPRSAKARATAAKVALMKMKMHAVGDKGCPEEERVYLSVHPPLVSNKPPQPMFFSKTWSIGLTIDAISDRLKVTNNNNVQDAKKLRLFSSEDGQLLPTEVSLSGLVDQQLVCSGSTVILEYVDNDCVEIEDLAQYTLS